MYDFSIAGCDLALEVLVHLSEWISTKYSCTIIKDEKRFAIS